MLNKQISVVEVVADRTIASSDLASTILMSLSQAAIYLDRVAIVTELSRAQAIAAGEESTTDDEVTPVLRHKVLEFSIFSSTRFHILFRHCHPKKSNRASNYQQKSRSTLNFFVITLPISHMRDVSSLTMLELARNTLKPLCTRLLVKG